MHSAIIRLHKQGGGGTGSQVLTNLARLDVTLRALGHPGLFVTLYDPDTVSYTHLDVYKRQLYIYEAVKDMQVANVELTGSWEKTLLQIEQHTLETRSFMPVSYTHLDVYKRQGLSWLFLYYSRR